MGDSYELELFVKASSDGKGLGECIHCHRFMMILALKGIPAKVTTIDLSRKPDFFIKNYTGLKLPFLVHNDKALDDINEIQDHIDSHFPEPSLRCNDRSTVMAGDGLFKKFSAWIRNKELSKDSFHRDALMEEVKKFNNFLESSDKEEGKYLGGDDLNTPDCVLLPKLHQMRIALAYFKDFAVPQHFNNYHRYLAAADAHSIFSSTKCDEMEILKGWSKHAGDIKKVQKLIKADALVKVY